MCYYVCEYSPVLFSLFCGVTFILSIDINECELERDNCHIYATCSDIVGSFECTCNNGFEGDGVNCTGMYELKI